MSLRDKLAVAIIGGMASLGIVGYSGRRECAAVARKAYRLAGAMLESREEVEEE